MATKPNRLRIDQHSDLAEQLRAIVDGSGYLEVDTGDAVYHLFVSPKQTSKPTPEAVTRSIAGIRAAAGSWKDVDVEAFKKYLAERRSVHPRSPVRL